MWQNIVLVLPVILPVLAGLAAWKIEARTARNALVGAALVVNALLTLLAVTAGSEEYVLWQLTAAVPVYFHVDGISKLFALLISCMWALVGIYSFEYMRHEENENRFYLFYMISLGVLIGLSFSGNLVTMYMFYELMTLMTLPLVLHEMTKEAVAAGIKYLLYSVFGASLALLGIFFFFRYGTSIAFTPGGVLTAESMAGHEKLMQWGVFAMIVGFGVKAGMFPLHGWLPTAHPVAPAPASAVLSGVITKAGVLGVIRVAYYLAGPDFIRGTWIQTAWMTLALCTVFMGSMLAYREGLLKKRLAYSTVSQVSYILTGLSTLNPMGFVGALLHVVCHSVIKNTLFMSAGAIIYKTGKTRVDELRGIGKEMPAVIWCFTIVSAALIGIPPTCGFISKWYLAGGALKLGETAFSWIAPCVLLVSAILTAGYLLPITIRGFFPGHDFDYAALEKKEPSAVMLVPLIMLAAAALLIGLFPAALISFGETIAALLM
ncbi:MAG: proton-conducting membrane transporter [Clostridia bacterium]|nr:proton-conducting membrane transporter [Clostridia bacterium]